MVAQVFKAPGRHFNGGPCHAPWVGLDDAPKHGLHVILDDTEVADQRGIQEWISPGNTIGARSAN
eukprot:9194447-Pyramimonas_sp.AAC.1